MTEAALLQAGVGVRNGIGQPWPAVAEECETHDKPAAREAAWTGRNAAP
jgi:hypothetical protein